MIIICYTGMVLLSCNTQLKEELYLIMNQDVIEENYTTETYNQYKNTYDYAKKLYDNPFSSENKLINAKVDLEEAIQNLKFASRGIYQIDYSYSLIKNNSVGNEWNKMVKINNTSFDSGNLLTMSLNSIVKVNITIIEDDKNPDMTSVDLSLTLENESIISKNITITEDDGRYKGSEAVWQIIFKVTLLERV